MAMSVRISRIFCRLSGCSSREGKLSINVARLSTATPKMSDKNKPRKSGDKGPERNYQKKMAKKAIQKEVNTPVKALMEGLKVSEGGEQHSSTTPDMEVLLKGLQMGRRR